MSTEQRAHQLAIVIGALLMGSVTLVACEREARRLRESPPAAAAEPPTVSTLQPGPALISTNTLRAGNAPPGHIEDPYADNAFEISQGQRLFDSFNCSGCHAHGGGGMGPPLMDDRWIYGSDPGAIFSTIVEGRPNGMPSFRGKLSNSQVWQLVAYVRAMSGMGRKDVRPGRRDDMQMRSSEQNTQTNPPRNSGTPATGP